MTKGKIVIFIGDMNIWPRSENKNNVTQISLLSTLPVFLLIWKMEQRVVGPTYYIVLAI